jgi:hypothetical protein
MGMSSCGGKVRILLSTLSDAQIQLISGHKTKKSLEVYQHLSLQAVESAYQEAVHSLNI